jgi:enamine deaminase RidA (YjgF/YER057c/UK114 family)
MTKTSINPETMHPPGGAYSYGLGVSQSSRLLFISGQIPQTKDGTIPDGFEAQCHQVWRNIGEVLRAGAMTMDNLVKVSIFLTRHEDISLNSAIRRQYLGDAQHALTVIVVQTLRPTWLLEIEAIAAA